MPLNEAGPSGGLSLALLLADRGVTKSHSRPHVSDDNPYSEAQFKTLKYQPHFPARFETIEHARAFCQRFFRSNVNLSQTATYHVAYHYLRHMQSRVA